MKSRFTRAMVHIIGSEELLLIYTALTYVIRKELHWPLQRSIGRKIYTVLWASSAQTMQRNSKKRLVSFWTWLTTVSLRLFQYLDTIPSLNLTYVSNTNILKGTMIQQQPGQVTMEISLVPPKILKWYSQGKWHIDVCHIKSLCILCSKSDHLFLTEKQILDEEAGTLLKIIKAIVQQYTKSGFCVVVIFGNSQFECLQEDLMSKQQIDLNTCAAN